MPDFTSSSRVPLPPHGPDELLAWADAHGVAARLDDLIVGADAADGTSLPGRPGERLSYRALLATPGKRPHDAAASARQYLHRLATLVAAARARRAHLDAHGREPEDATLASFVDRLRAALDELAQRRETAPRPEGTYEPVGVQIEREPVPLLRYEERPLVRLGERPDVVLALLGFFDEPLRWSLHRGATPVRGGVVPPAAQATALEAAIDLVRDPDATAEQDALADALRVPAWKLALGSLDGGLARLGARAAPGAASETRVAYRVSVTPDGAVDVEPMLQRRTGTGAYSKGARLAWHQVPAQAGLTELDRRAVNAHDDRFVARPQAHPQVQMWGGPTPPARVFGVLRVLIDHVAVFADDGTGARIDLRQGRLRLRFAASSDGTLTPWFELLGTTLSPAEVRDALRDDEHIIVARRPARGPLQIALARISPEAAEIVRAVALGPVRFPPEAHDALASRLEPLQETMDIELPSTWTRTIVPSDGRPIARLELLVSGALQVRLGVRPVKLGPYFLPGEGPALVLEGHGPERHGARRDHAAEREAARALSERLGLSPEATVEPWSWRVPEGDPAFHVVAVLQAARETVTVEWADDMLSDRGSVGRGAMRLEVADRREWLAVEGEAEIAGEAVPLAALLAAIREDRRYVRVGAGGFARIEDSLREALARAEAGLFDARGGFEITPLATDALVGLVEDEAQIEASAGFAAVRRRMREAAADTLRAPPELAARLRPYQTAGATWLARLAGWGAGALLADEMGLGKTLQTLAVLSHRAAEGPALVIAPTSVVPNWAAEAARFAPQLDVRLYRGADRRACLRNLGAGAVVVTSYTLATMDVEALSGVRFASLVLDEAQAVKNATTERAKALRDLDAAWRLGLTGTPIENHLGELWSVLRVISPGLLGSWEQFRGRYAVPIEKFGDLGRRAALARLLHPFLLRRTKAEVARDLPPRTDLVRRVRLSDDERELYDQLRASTLAAIEDTNHDPDKDGQEQRFFLLAALTRMRQLCCHPRLVYPRTAAGSTKAAHLLELLADLREGGHKALVFSQFRSFLELLAPRLRQHGHRVLTLDGTTPAEIRTRRIDAFQSGEADVFLISLKAGGFGLNLTAADTVIHLDPWWNPAVEEQATARAHRIGQRNPVTSVRLVAEDTIEEGVLDLHASKRALAAGVLAGAALAASLAPDELVALIRGGAVVPPR